MLTLSLVRKSPNIFVKKRRPLSSLMALIAGLVLGAWVSGLILFASEISLFREPPIDASTDFTEAIIVLTGGSDRLNTGLSLLSAGKGRKLFISGVPPGLTVKNILAKYQAPKELLDCCVVLGHTADNTVGNAEETRAWMEKEGFKSLRLVTANYHMPRSLMIFRRYMPKIEIIPHPVAPESVKLSQWWARPGTAGLLISEYNKYIYALVKEWLKRKE